MSASELARQLLALNPNERFAQGRIHDGQGDWIVVGIWHEGRWIEVYSKTISPAMPWVESRPVLVNGEPAIKEWQEVVIEEVAA